MNGRPSPLGARTDSLASLDWDMYETDPNRHPDPSPTDSSPPSEMDGTLVEGTDEVINTAGKLKEGKKIIWQCIHII